MMNLASVGMSRPAGILRKAALPLVAAALLVGTTACTRTTKTEKQEAEEQPYSLYGAYGPYADEIYPNFDTIAANNEIAYYDSTLRADIQKFKQKPDKTMADTVAMSNNVDDLEDKINKLNYMKEQKAEYDINHGKIDIKSEFENIVKKYDAIIGSNNEMLQSLDNLGDTIAKHNIESKLDKYI